MGMFQLVTLLLLIFAVPQLMPFTYISSALMFFFSVSELLMQISTLRRLIKRQTASFFRIEQDDYSRKNRNLQYEAEDSDSDANESPGLLPRRHGKHVNK